MPKDDITPIEKEVHIAADAGQAIAAYLEELVSKLVRTGIEDAFAVTSQFEEKIIELITAQNSESKLGLDVVMSLIQEELGTPDDVVKQYSDSRNMISTFNKIPNDATLLQKRETRDVHKFKNWWILGIIGLIAVNAIIILSYFINYLDGFQVVAFFSYIAIMLAFIIMEDNGSKSAVLPFKYGFTVNLRYAIRGIVTMTVLVSFIIGNKIKGYWMLEVILYASLIGFLIYEFTIYYRDHKIGKFPLEPKRRPTFRLFTLPYLFLITALVFGLIISLIDNPNDLSYLVVLFGFLASTWAFITHSAVTPRFYIIAYILQIVPIINIGVWDYGGLIFVFPFLVVLVDGIRMVKNKPSIIKSIIDEVKIALE